MHAIKFLENDDRYDTIKAYANEKGFPSAGSFARFAVFTYMRRNPSKEDRAYKLQEKVRILKDELVRVSTRHERDES